MSKFRLMMRMQALLGVLALATLSSPSRVLADATNISAADAIHFVGQVATVCGKVASAKYASETNQRMTEARENSNEHR